MSSFSCLFFFITALGFACVCICVWPLQRERGSPSDGGEGEEEQEASRATTSRHYRNIWHWLTLTHRPVFVLLFLRERKGKWHQAHHVRPKRQMREGGRGENTGSEGAWLHKTQVRPPLGMYVSVCPCVCATDCLQELLRTWHYFTQVRDYDMDAEWLQTNGALCHSAAPQLLRVCNTFQSEEVMS